LEIGYILHSQGNFCAEDKKNFPSGEEKKVGVNFQGTARYQEVNQKI
jgi:hypothetical protein